MTTFYTDISPYYDDIFPVGEFQLRLISEAAGIPPKQLLDVACGSGGYAKRLKEMGYSVTAIDLNEEMIQHLKQKDHEIDAHVLNMLEIEKLRPTFDVIYCIGNSLVHLDNLEEIETFLTVCKRKLKRDGKLILQIVNYDRILEKNIDRLPTITREEKNLTFERYYQYFPERQKIAFKTILTVAGKEIENRVFLYPLQSETLKQLLEKVGFQKIHMYGNFKKDPYNRLESVPLVVMAH